VNLRALVGLFYKGYANKAVVSAAASLINAAESGHWTSTQSIVGYVGTILVWLIPNLTSQSPTVTVQHSQMTQQ
jgi:hypothetical protein